MANPKPTSGWKKGQCGNPKGRPKIPDDIKISRALTKIDFETITNKFVGMTREELNSVKNDPRLSALDLMLLSIIQKAIIQGDQIRLTFLLDRLIGKVADKIETNQNMNQNIMTVPAMTKESAIALLAQIKKDEEDGKDKEVKGSGSYEGIQGGEA